MTLRSLPSGTVLLLAALAGCKNTPAPERTYYDTQIQPVFNSFCVGNTSPCHRIDPATGTALGNLDLSSFEAVQKRRDVLRTYGSYPQPLLLLKAMPEASTPIPYLGDIKPSEILHAGGKPIQPATNAFFELKNWLDNGATLSGFPPPSGGRQGQGGCNPTVPTDEQKVPVDPGSPAFRRFVSEVQPVLRASCAFGTCHGSPQSDFYVTCGDTDEQRSFNFVRVSGFVAKMGTAVEQSELLLRPLDPRAGGISHTGGVFFTSRADTTWKSFRDWAAEVQKMPPEAPMRSAGETFFAERVMPILIRRGCALEGCHSPNGFNDFRLRPGAQGFLSDSAIHRNYEATLREFVSLNTPDVRQSRLVKKTIFESNGGITHRGGALLESEGHDSKEPCPTPYDPTANPTAFCTVKEWHRLERVDHAKDVSPLAMGDTVPLAYVSRPPDGDSLLEFDTFRGGADLLIADATMGANGRVESVGTPRSALTSCTGLTAGAVDVRGPEWSYDGSKLVFSARSSEATGHDLWLLDVGAGTCRRLTSDDGRMQGAVKVHNFDPVFAPDGSLVFASTRAGTVSPKRFLPASDLYRVGPTLDFGAPERMTYLTPSELGPAFMQNGQLTMTSEKATPDFYQLAGRRINWDLTDYHPLIAQRAESSDTFKDKKPSVGYQQATEIREGLDRNFVFVGSDVDAKGAGGALLTFNRSIGPFEAGRNEVTFLKAVRLVDPAATGRSGTTGVYRSPYALPDGEYLASYAANVSNPAADVPRYDLFAVDPQTHARRMLVMGGGKSVVEATLGYKRSERLLFKNIPQLVFGGRSTGEEGDAIAHFPDLPMLATLLDANLRRGRNVTAMDAATALKVYEVVPPTSKTPDTSKVTGTQSVYQERKALGVADLESDRSLRVSLPSRKPLILELVDGTGKAVITMREEHQMGPGEVITPGVPRKLFDGVCGGCHGSVSGKETDVVVTPDALTGASVSMSRDGMVKMLR